MKKESITILASLAVIGGITSAVFIKDMKMKVLANEPAAEVNEEQAEASVSQEDIPRSQEVQEIRTLEKAVDYTIADKSDVYHMMLNSIDYYNTASGTVIRADGTDLINVITFQTDLLNAEAYSASVLRSTDKAEDVSAVSLSDVDFDNVVYCADGMLTTVSDGLSETVENRVTYLSDCSPIDDSERISTADDGNPIYRYRQNPTNVMFASICLFPQEMAFGFLQDQELWEITGITEKNGLTCYIIEGKTEEAYGEKLNVAAFEFFVDVNTGVLVQYEGYSADGTLSDYMYTQNIQFDDNAEPVNVLDTDSQK